jgi:HlyD family secretion protein
MPSSTGKLLRLGLTTLLMGGAAVVAVIALRPSQPSPVLGMVRATEIEIQPEVSGRIANLPFHPGDPVKAGDVVALLSNPELAAAVVEAQAAVGVAAAARNRVYAGPRQEQVDIAAHEVDKAKSNLVLARQELTRMATLAGQGNAPLQSLDNAKAAAASAEANLRTAQSTYDQAKRGPTAEDREIADATLAAAESALAVLLQRLAKLTLRAPVDGAVEVVVAEPGEAEIPGRTILTITADRQLWFDFNIREDLLDGLLVGEHLTLKKENGGAPIQVRVSEMRRLGDFATWRAARAVGDHDLNTFAVRADLVAPVDGLQPGMTVWISQRQPK